MQTYLSLAALTILVENVTRPFIWKTERMRQKERGREGDRGRTINKKSERERQRWM